MQKEKEIKSAIENIKYYGRIICELSKTQFNIDCEQGEKIGINPIPGTVRLENLAAITVNCSWIKTYCDGIEANLKAASEQDKTLYPKGEDNES